jgi:hypothetical protein
LIDIINININDNNTITLKLTVGDYTLKFNNENTARQWYDKLEELIQCCRVNERYWSSRKIVQDYAHQAGDAGDTGDAIDKTITGKHFVSDEEMQKIGRLKKEHGLNGVDNATLVRFLRARKGVVDDAATMLMNYVQWRKSKFPIARDRVISQITKGKFVMAGRDLDGDIVIYIHGRTLGPSTYESLDEHMDSVYYLLEIVCAECLEDGLDKFTIIYNRLDVDNVESDNDWVKAIGKALADYYPERMKKCVVFPTNAVFRYIWKIVKIFFDPNTASKVCFVGNFSQLTQYFHQDEILKELGGNNEYVYDPEHVWNKGMLSEDFVRKERFQAKAQIVYDF